MNKPEVGTPVKFDVKDSGYLGSDRGEIVAVFRTLREDWGEYGHEAMALRDEIPDQPAEWYAVVQVGRTIFGIASYEAIE